MRALILQFEAACPPDHLAARLNANGAAWDVVRMDRPHPPVSLADYDALIALGGGMNVDETGHYPFLAEALDLIGTAIERQVPYLGICLGGQLLARALEAPVVQLPRPEVGVVRVTPVPGMPDRLLHGLEGGIDTVQFHEDSFAVPPNSVLLASSVTCSTQIVRCGACAYGLQFHPEVSMETFERWVDESYAAITGDTDPDAARAVAARVREQEGELRRQADLLLDNFVRLVDHPA